MTEEQTNNTGPEKTLTQGLWMTTPTGALVNIEQVAFFAKIDPPDSYKQFNTDEDSSIVIAKMATGDQIPAIVGDKEVCDQFIANMSGYLTSLTYSKPDGDGDGESG